MTIAAHENNGLTSADSRPALVLLREEARVRGFKNALSLKRFCVRLHVPIYRTGKMLWVAPAEIDKAVLRATSEAPAPRERATSAHVAVADSVADLMMGARRTR